MHIKKNIGEKFKVSALIICDQLINDKKINNFEIFIKKTKKKINKIKILK